MSEFEQADVNQAEQAEPEKKSCRKSANAAETVEAATRLTWMKHSARRETTTEQQKSRQLMKKQKFAETMEDQLTKDMPDLRTVTLLWKSSPG